MTILIYGPPCGGKSTLVRELHERGDLVVDFDKIHSALSGLDPYDHHNDITTFVVEAMDAIKRRLQVHPVRQAWLTLVVLCPIPVSVGDPGERSGGAYEVKEPPFRPIVWPVIHAASSEAR